MKRVVAVAEIQGHPECVFVGESALSMSSDVYLWMKKVREQGLLPEVHYWTILETDDHLHE